MPFYAVLNWLSRQHTAKPSRPQINHFLKHYTDVGTPLQSERELCDPRKLSREKDSSRCSWSPPALSEALHCAILLSVLSNDKVEQTLANFRRPPQLTWNNLIPFSTPGNGPAKPLVTHHFLCSFSKWGTAPSGNNCTRAHTTEARRDCWEQKKTACSDSPVWSSHC